MIARDRNAVIYPSGSDPLEERTYYVQNWRGDVVTLMKQYATTWIVGEHVRYSAYGRPFCIPSADYNENTILLTHHVDGIVDSYDQSGAGSFTEIYNTERLQTYHPDMRSDFDLNGVINSSDQSVYNFFFTQQRSIATSSSPAGQDVISKILGNRKGYAGYEHEPWATGNGTPWIVGTGALGGANMMLARNRFYRADLGTWMRRDPIGYEDGENLYEYVGDMPIIKSDFTGLYGKTCNAATASATYTYSIFDSNKVCGPDVTDFLIYQMNKNRWDPVTTSCYNSGLFTFYQCLWAFAQKVKPGGPWDFKGRMKGNVCPRNCPATVELCGYCVHQDVIGNIHYGYVGSMAGLHERLLLRAPGCVQSGSWHDDPQDSHAIVIGIDLTEKSIPFIGVTRTNLCQLVSQRLMYLNTTGTEGCRKCTMESFFWF